MNCISLFGTRVFHRFSCCVVVSRKLSDGGFGENRRDSRCNGKESVEETVSESSDFDPILKEYGLLENEGHPRERFSVRRSFFEDVRRCTVRVLEVLEKDEPGFDAKAALDELDIKVSGPVVRGVLFEILKVVNYGNKMRCAKLGFKFFVWSGLKENYRHTAEAYHLMMKIFADCEEFKAMWRLVDEMIEKGHPTTARTFNILICTCVKQYKLIEWLYQQMLAEGYSQDILTYNIMMCAKYRLGKLDQFHRLLDEMGRSGFSPDFHTYNLLLNVLDGLSRAGNMEACKYFFDEMIKYDCLPDVVCYTVMITGYIVAGELENALELFDEMVIDGQLPNVFTYNSIIRGLCMVGKFEEACSMLKEMESRGVNPNFTVYSTLVSYLRNAGKLSKAHEVIQHMVEKGQYAHLLSNLKRHRRC
ncbi:hypothetical protein ACLB2K_075165 [Fragaria x ananassa]